MCSDSCCHEILEWPWVYFSLTLLPTGVVLWSKTRASKRMDKSPNSGRSPLEHYRRLDPSIFLDLLDDCSSSMARWRFRTKTDIICDDCGPHVVEFSILRDLRFSLILRLQFDSAEKRVKLALSFESPVQWLKRGKKQQKRTFALSHWSDWNLMDFLTGRSLGTSVTKERPLRFFLSDDLMTVANKLPAVAHDPEIRLASASNFPIDPTGVLCHEFTVQLGKVALCVASLSYNICHIC